MNNCICTHHRTPAVESFDPVTGEWDPERKTEHWTLEFHPDCEMHANPLQCFACPRTTCGHLLGEAGDTPWQIRPGWSIRADSLFVACPDHAKEMPPA